MKNTHIISIAFTNYDNNNKPNIISDKIDGPFDEGTRRPLLDHESAI